MILRSSHRSAITALFLLFISIALPNALLAVTWARVYGDIQYGRTEAYSVQQTMDGGYILAGDKDTGSNRDFWIIRLDAEGDVIWQKTYGESQNNDYALSILETSEGNFVVAGSTYLSDFSSSSRFWVLKLDEDGEILWQKRYELSGFAFSIQQTVDGGFIVGGEQYSGAQGSWILKLDSSGEILWQKVYAIEGVASRTISVRPTSDGGYIAIGFLVPFFFSGSIFKLDAFGNIEWQKDYSPAAFISGQQTADGGYVVVGSDGGAVMLVLKLDASGNPVWQKKFVGSQNTAGRSIQQTSDGGYVAVGESGDYGLMVRLDSSGNIIFHQMYKDSTADQTGLKSVDQTTDGGYILAGSPTTGSNNLRFIALKVDSGGSIDTPCTILVDGDLSAQSVSLWVSNSSLVASDTSAFAMNTSVAAVPTQETAYQLCPCSTVSLAPGSLPDGTVGEAYDYLLQATGGSEPYNYKITDGSLPFCLSLNSGTGQISGSPCKTGLYLSYLSVLDSNSCFSDPRQEDITIVCPNFSISQEILSDGKIGVYYNQTLTADGTTAPVRFEVSRGNLPPGLRLKGSAGTIQGFPALPGTYRFTITGWIGDCSSSRTYQVNIQSNRKIFSSSR